MRLLSCFSSPGDATVVDLPVVVALPDPDEVTIDLDWRVVTWRDRAVSPSPLERDLLQCLLEDISRTWTFELVQRRVWGNDHLGGRSHLQTVVKRLRRKLVDLQAPLQRSSLQIRCPGYRVRLHPWHTRL